MSSDITLKKSTNIKVNMSSNITLKKSTTNIKVNILWSLTTYYRSFSMSLINWKFNEHKSNDFKIKISVIIKCMTSK